VDEVFTRIDNLVDVTPAGRPAMPAVDRRDGAVYQTDQELRTATKIALATGRPLLLLGPPGSGKSSYAAYVARNLAWHYYEHVITRMTQAQDLLWTFDAVRRLAAAGQRARSGEDAPRDEIRDLDYVEPGVLWWAFDRPSALRRGIPAGEAPPARPPDPPDKNVGFDTGPDTADAGAVVLIDEIGKAAPDVLDALLVPLGSLRFRVAETGTDVVSSAPRHRRLIVLTSNDERDPSPAFLRRCVVHTLAPPWDVDHYLEIARLHLVGATGNLSPAETRLCRRLAEFVITARESSGPGKSWDRSGPSTAEFLDAVWACRELGIVEGDAQWELLEQTVLRKGAGGR